MSEQFWWYMARASGMVGWALAVATILWGVALATRALGDHPRPPWLLDLHRYLGALTMAAVVLHMVALVADSFVHFDVVDLLVPFAAEWKAGPVAWGVVAFWLVVAVEVTSMLMRKLSRRVWRRVHVTSYGFALLATVHALTAGTDAANPGFRWSVLIACATATFFIVYRALAPGRRSGKAPVQSRL